MDPLNGILQKNLRKVITLRKYCNGREKYFNTDIKYIKHVNSVDKNKGNGNIIFHARKEKFNSKILKKTLLIF